MKIKIVKNDITKVKADIVVNTANPYPVIGAGTDSAIYEAAGAEKLLKERLKIGNIEPGEARITPGFDLCRYIIHTVGPVYIDGNHDEEKTLRRCYRNSLKLAKKNNCKSIVFPLISAGTYGFPKDDAISVAISEMNDFLIKSVTDMKITIAVLSDGAFFLLKKIEEDAESAITPEDVERIKKKEYGNELYREIARDALRREKIEKDDNVFYSFSEDSKSFSDMVYYYRSIRNEEFSTIYKRVELDRRQFNKYINNERLPSKKDAIKLCIGLRLTLSESFDLLSRAGYAFNPSVPEEQTIVLGIKENKTYKEILFDLKSNGQKYF